jgi:hypothetical protein
MLSHFGNVLMGVTIMAISPQQAVVQYLDGHEDLTSLPSVFHSEALIEGFRDGNWESFNLNGFNSLVAQLPNELNTENNQYRMLFESADLAIAQAQVEVLDKCFTDFLVLKRDINNQWRIQYKTYTDECNDDLSQ